MLEQYVYDPEAIVTDLSRRLDRGDTSHLSVQDPVNGDPVPDELLEQLDQLLSGHAEPNDRGLTLLPGAIREENREAVLVCLGSIIEAGGDISIQANL